MGAFIIRVLRGTGWEPTAMKILIAIDGSPAALDAARHALQLARDGLRTGFVLATVQDPTYLYEMVLAPDAEVLERVSGAVGARALAGAEELFKSAGMAYEREIGSGDPGPHAGRDRAAIRMHGDPHGRPRYGGAARGAAGVGVARAC